MKIKTATIEHLGAWSTMRCALGRWDSVEDHANQAAEIYLSGNPDRAAFIAIDGAGAALGFAKAERVVYFRKDLP